MSEVALSKLWKCDRKTVSKMLDHMNKLGILLLYRQDEEVFTHCYAFLHGLLTARNMSILTMFPSTKETIPASLIIMTSTTAFPNKEDPPIKNGGTSPTQLANSSFSSLTSGNGNNGEEEDVPPPSVSDMELEQKPEGNSSKNRMEAEECSQLLLLG